MEGNDKRMKDGSDKTQLYARLRAIRKGGKLHKWCMTYLPRLMAEIQTIKEQGDVHRNGSNSEQMKG